MKELRALSTRRNRLQKGRFLAEGVRVVEDLLASELTVRLVAMSSSLEDSERGNLLTELADRRGVPRRVLPEDELTRFAQTDSPQGVIAVAEIPEATLDRLELTAARRPALILDAIQDPGNFGTLVRSAEALGAMAVIALPGTVDPWNPKSVRSAAGSSFRLPILQEEWSVARDWLKGSGFMLLGADMAGEPLEAEPPGRAALVVGNEGAGLSEGVRRSVDRLVSVPLRGRAESLNVAAAAAILLYELTS